VVGLLSVMLGGRQDGTTSVKAHLRAKAKLNGTVLNDFLPLLAERCRLNPILTVFERCLNGIDTVF
jgi:hypothetical protein